MKDREGEQFSGLKDNDGYLKESRAAFRGRNAVIAFTGLLGFGSLIFLGTLGTLICAEQPRQHGIWAMACFGLVLERSVEHVENAGHGDLPQ